MTVAGEAVELRVAGDVLEGLVGAAAVDGGFVGGLLGRGQLAGGVGQELGSGDAESVEEDEFGVAAGVIAQVGILGELDGCEGEGLAQRCGCLWLWIVSFCLVSPPCVLLKIFKK